MIKKLPKYSSLILLLAPSFAFAFSLAQSTFKDIVIEVVSVLKILNPILITLAFLVFFWGLTKFILHTDNQKDVQSGKNYMIWGVIALFILIVFRALIVLIGNDLGLETENMVPFLPTSSANVTTSETYQFPN